MKLQNETQPEIDYLSKDYASFRRLMVDHLTNLAPNWKEAHPADLGNVLLDILAYAADYLSYYQDAVATETYLGTARLRRSVRRHVRLLDYTLHEGCNARVWVQVQVEAGDSAEGVLLKKGTQLFTRLEHAGRTPVINPQSADYADALSQKPVVFETMHDIMLFPEYNAIDFYSPGQGVPQLPRGATSAILRDKWAGKPSSGRKLENLRAGDVLVFEELRDPETGLESGANPSHRHAVRLTHVSKGIAEDATKSPIPVVRIDWSIADALPFPLTLSAYFGGDRNVSVSVARGNIILTDHGRTIFNEELPQVQPESRYRPRLRLTGLTYSTSYDHDEAGKLSAAETILQDHSRAMPAMQLVELGNQSLETGDDLESVLLATAELNGKFYPVSKWRVMMDLLNSGKFARDCIVEMEDDGRAYLRFGFGEMGWQPVAGDRFLATYRIGNGTDGNIGPNAIAHIVTEEGRISAVRNFLPAQGGTEPMKIETARLHAPAALHTQMRCVTEADYVAAACEYFDVARAAAQLSWSGSWHIATIYVQRHGGWQVDQPFRDGLRSYLEPLRLANSDLDVREPNFVSLGVELRLYTLPDHLLSVIDSAVKQTLGNDPDGFFYPENFAFGQAVYQSQIVSRAMAVPGVARVEVLKFGPIGTEELQDQIKIGKLEIARLDNDPQHPENGILTITYKCIQ